MPTVRSAILIRCTAEEAELVRQAAGNERRTVSGFTLKVLMEYIARTERQLGRLADVIGAFEMTLVTR
jgi:uncharacterized protein (DUF1778 family)